MQREYLSSGRFIIRVLFAIVQAQSTHTRSVRIHEVHAGDKRGMGNLYFSSSTASPVPVKSRAMLVRADGIACFLERFILAPESFSEGYI